MGKIPSTAFPLHCYYPPRDESPSPTVLQVSWLAVYSPLWCTCTISPRVERTFVTGQPLTVRFYTVVGKEVGAVLKEQINNLLNKRPIRVVPALEVNKRWYSRHFIAMKKGGGLLISIFICDPTLSCMHSSQWK